MKDNEIILYNDKNEECYLLKFDSVEGKELYNKTNGETWVGNLTIIDLRKASLFTGF